jgi:Sulfatase
MKIFQKKKVWWFVYIAFVYLAMDAFYAKQRFSEIGGITQGNLTFKEHLREIAFVIEYLIAFFALFAFMKMKKLYAFPALIIMWILILVELSFYFVANKPLNLVDIAIMNAEVGQTKAALAEFLPHIIKAAVFSSFLFVPMIIYRFKSKETLHGIYAFLSFSALCFIFAITLIIRGESSVLGFPKGFSYGIGSASLKVNDAINAMQEPHVYPVLVKNIYPKIKKIVMIIDESINYDEFKKLSFEGNDTIVNYGRIRSGANCSAASNYILRKGTWKRDANTTNVDLRDIENIFALARKGGYKSVYLDNADVLRDVGLKNYFDKIETESMDIIHQMSGEGHTRDMASLIEMKKLLQHDKVFIYTNKIGAHFPYEHMIPPADRTSDKMTNYRKALELNTLNYLNELAKIIDDETVVFYTSDHGQNFADNQTHCGNGANIPAVEYSVPMMILTKNAPYKADFIKNKTLYEGKITHLELSESVRNAMGFEVEGIGSLFKPTLILEGKFCGLYGPPHKTFGINPKCRMLN